MHSYLVINIFYRLNILIRLIIVYVFAYVDHDNHSK